MDIKTFLKVEGIHKSFPGVKALSNVTMDIKRGEVLALAGENGAGKSTLMKILGGEYQPDRGKIFINGQAVRIENNAASQKLGISIIYQELNTIPNVSIAENIFVGREKRKRGLNDRNSMNKEPERLLEQVGLRGVTPNTIAGTLSTAQKQMIEVAKALSLDSKLIIMDEPTSSLTTNETEKLFKIIDNLKSKGTSVVFISHRMNEIMALADRVLVMRDGEIAGLIEDRNEITEDLIIRYMVGRELNRQLSQKTEKLGKEVMRVENLCTPDFLNNISFSLYEREILGFAGLVGAGRSEVMRAIFGVDKMSGGVVYIDGKKATIRNTSDALRYGLGFVPEDRKQQALVLGMTVRENTTLAALKQMKRRFFIDKAKEENVTNARIEQLDIKTPSTEQKVLNLSGGNQQKVVIGKWLETVPRILIVDEPTRGIDIRSKTEIHNLIIELASQGMAVILVSSEMQEILNISDRIIVMHDGRITGELSRQEGTQERIMELAIS
mgnify:CR=1 FL=1